MKISSISGKFVRDRQTEVNQRVQDGQPIKLKEKVHVLPAEPELPDNVVVPETESELPEALDGGYGWLVLAASFSVNFIVNGTCFSIGIIYLEFLDYFGDSKSKTSWVSSVINGTYLFMG